MNLRFLIRHDAMLLLKFRFRAALRRFILIDAELRGAGSFFGKTRIDGRAPASLPYAEWTLKKLSPHEI